MSTHIETSRGSFLYIKIKFPVDRGVIIFGDSKLLPCNVQVLLWVGTGVRNDCDYGPSVGVLVGGVFGIGVSSEVTLVVSTLVALLPVLRGVTITTMRGLAVTEVRVAVEVLSSVMRVSIKVSTAGVIIITTL